METLIDILGYGVIIVTLVGVIYVFVKLLATGLDALTKHDD